MVSPSRPGQTSVRCTIAREMGEPTRRKYEARQLVVRNATDILQTAISRRFPDRSRPYSLDITMPDITASDNQLLASAALAVGALTKSLAERRKWLDDTTVRIEPWQ